MAKILAVANQKGGVGKTSTAVNLGAAFADSGQRVLLVDLDPQGNATMAFGIDNREERRSIYHVLIGACAAADAVTVPFPPYPHVIPATPDLSGAEVELVSAIGREYRLQEGIGAILDDYDLVLIDCPPSLGLLTVNALVMADTILIPMPCEFLPMVGLNQLLDIIEIIRRRLNPKLTVEGILFTMYDGRSNLTRQVADEVRKFFPDKVFRTMIPRNVRIGESQSHGKPAIWFDRQAKGSLAYAELARELSGAMFAH
ncbi:MAG: ParA family protein [Magnetococcales bacterium]|nr:ParA family protein [Magnetococcales bacterium]